MPEAVCLEVAESDVDAGMTTKLYAISTLLAACEGVFQGSSLFHNQNICQMNESKC